MQNRIKPGYPAKRPSFLRWLFRLNRVRVTGLLLLALLVVDVLDVFTRHDPDSFADPIGLLWGLLVLAGLFLRSWSAGIIRKNSVLVTVGPYSLARHPLYLGSLTAAIGFCLVIGDLKYFLAISLLFLIVYLPTIRKEEKILASLFAEAWPVYKKQTGLFFPKTMRLPLNAPWSLSIWRRNREYYAVGVSLAALITLAFFMYPQLYGFPWLG